MRRGLPREVWTDAMRAKVRAATKAHHANMTPAQRAELTRRQAEGRARRKAEDLANGIIRVEAKPIRRAIEPPIPEELMEEPMQPISIDPELKRALQVACVRWSDAGATWDTIERLCAIIVTERVLHRPLLLIRDAVDRGELHPSHVGHIASLTDALMRVYGDILPGHRYTADALALLVGIDPEAQVVPIPLPPVEGSSAWVQ